MPPPPDRAPPATEPEPAPAREPLRAPDPPPEADSAQLRTGDNAAGPKQPPGLQAPCSREPYGPKRKEPPPAHLSPQQPNGARQPPPSLPFKAAPVVCNLVLEPRQLVPPGLHKAPGGAFKSPPPSLPGSVRANPVPPPGLPGHIQGPPCPVAASPESQIVPVKAPPAQQDGVPCKSPPDEKRTGKCVTWAPADIAEVLGDGRQLRRPCAERGGLHLSSLPVPSNAGAVSESGDVEMGATEAPPPVSPHDSPMYVSMKSFDNNAWDAVD